MPSMYTIGAYWKRLPIAVKKYCLPAFLMLLTIAVGNTPPTYSAEPYQVTIVGDGNVPEPDSLANVIGSEAIAGDTIELLNDLIGDWNNWAASDGYVQFMPGIPLSGEITVELNGFTLGGTALDMVTGAGTYLFQNGTLGTSANNLGVGATADGTTTVTSGAVNANTLQVGRINGASVLTLDGSLSNAAMTNVSGYGSQFVITNGASHFSNGPLSVTQGGIIDVQGTGTLRVNGDISVDSVGFTETAGNYAFNQSQITSTTPGNGGNIAFASNNFSVTNGASVDLSQFAGFPTTGYYVNPGNTLLVSGVFAHAATGTSFEARLTITGNFAVNGGTATISDGGVLSRAVGINVTSGGTLTVSGAHVDPTLNVTEYRSTAYANGLLSIGGNSGNSSVLVLDGGLIDSITNIHIGNGAAGVLTVDGVNASGSLVNDALASTINFSGNLVVGNTAAGTLNITGGGVLNGRLNATQTTILGRLAAATVNLDGVGTRDTRSTLRTNDLFVAQGADTTLNILNGALVDVAGTATFGEGGNATVAIGGRGGVATVNNATLQTTGGNDIIVGNSGSATFTVTDGGAVISDGRTVLGNLAGSTGIVDLNYHWTAGGTAVAQGLYIAPQGNGRLVIGNGGLLTVNGQFAMAGQSSGYANNYGVATVNSGGELALGGGTFYNRDSTGTIGRVQMNGGSTLSGNGSVYAGDRFLMNGGTIAAGSRDLRDFQTGGTNQLTSIGRVDIYDNDSVTTQFANTTFRTELDRPTGGGGENITGRSDLAVVHGDLAVDSNFKVDISRVLDGDYQLVVADGGSIGGFTPVDLAGQGANSIAISLNGKTLKGNDRVDYTNGLTTELRNNNEIWLSVNSTSDGNVVTNWVGGNSGNAWDMTARNFNATTGPAGFAGNDQFLDGDIVNFDYANIDAANRTINITQGSQYVGDHATVPNVAVAEVRITGGGAGDEIVWNGGSIFAYNSALLTTLDLGDAIGTAPSGQLVKDGAGTLVINNANEFYGGIVLGAGGTTGGTVILGNEKGFGTYDTSSGYADKGLVFVQADTNLDVSRLNNGTGGTINNRFIVETGKTLTFNFGATDLKIAGNNALNTPAGYPNSGKGGGLFISDGGGIEYAGTGNLTFERNQARQGGGIYAERGYTFETPTAVTGNYASLQGGGVYAEKHFEMVSGSSISNNASQGAGGGFYAGDTGSLQPGDDRDLTLHGNTEIAGNVTGAAVGGGGYVESGRELNIETATSGDNQGGDVWFQDNYANVGFDPDDPVNGPRDMKNATRNAVHLSATNTAGTAADGAVINISGPYNTYFYDPITGDAGTTVNINGVQATGTNSTNLPADQYGTVIMRGDSAFYGSTNVAGNATFRMESFSETDGTYVQAVYGRKVDGSGPANTFTLQAGSRITGSGTIMADSVNLSGILDLDTGTFTKPAGKDGSGAISAADAATLGNLAVDGDVTVADSSVWNLNLTNNGGTDPSSDLVTVAGTTNFTGGTAGNRLTLNIDRLIHGRYTIMASSGGFNNYTANRQQSDAIVNYQLADGTTINLAAPPAGNADLMGRLRVTSYVDPTTGTSLYLDVAGRNRYITADSGGTWAYDARWEYDSSFNPTNTGNANINWSNLDSGPVTNVYLDGDMVRLTGGTYNLPGTVNPVDLFVSGTGDVTFTGAGSIKTYGLAASSLANGPDDTTIISTIGSGTNDYGIPLYTGKLHKEGLTTLTFANTGGNRFTQGVVIGLAGVPGGTIAFNSGRQLTVGAGQNINFAGSGTLHSTATTTLATAIDLNIGTTGTFDVDAGTTLTLNQLISGAGGINKTGGGILNVTSDNGTTAGGFTGGTTLSEGTLLLGHDHSFSQYTVAGGLNGLITVAGTGQKTFRSAANHTIENRFVVNPVVGNGLLMDIASGTTLTINSVAATGLTGGAIFVGAGADQLAFAPNSGHLVLSNNSAAFGGGIYTASTSGPLTFDNQLTLSGNTVTGDGGGIWSSEPTSPIVFNRQTTISNNQAVSIGGGMYTASGAVFNGATTISGNRAAYGGGIYSAVGPITVNAAGATTISGNQATIDGGAFFSVAGDTTLNATGGDITLSGNTAGVLGGAAYMGNGNLNLNATGGDITFTGNTAALGSAVYMVSGGVNVNASAGRTVVFDDSLYTIASNTLTKSGEGMLVFTGNESNQFLGTTNIDEGEFRVTQGTAYNSVAIPGQMNVAQGARVTGGGAINFGPTGTFDLQGTISADADAGNSGDVRSIGTLAVTGNVNFTGSTTAPSLVVDLDPGAGGFNPLVVKDSDVLDVTGNATVADGDKVVVNLHNYGAGLYLIMSTTGGINTGTFGGVNGIGAADGAFTATVNDRGLTSRHNIAFLRGGDNYNGTAITGNSTDLYLAANVNNLVMNCNGAIGNI